MVARVHCVSYQSIQGNFFLIEWPEMTGNILAGHVVLRCICLVSMLFINNAYLKLFRMLWDCLVIL